MAKKHIASYAAILGSIEIAYASNSSRTGWYLLNQDAKDDLELILMDGSDSDDSRNHRLERVNKNSDGTYEKTGKFDNVKVSDFVRSLRSYLSVARDRQK